MRRRERLRIGLLDRKRRDGVHLVRVLAGALLHQLARGEADDAHGDAADDQRHEAGGTVLVARSDRCRRLRGLRGGAARGGHLREERAAVVAAVALGADALVLVDLVHALARRARRLGAVVDVRLARQPREARHAVARVAAHQVQAAAAVRARLAGALVRVRLAAVALEARRAHADSLARDVHADAVVQARVGPTGRRRVLATRAVEARRALALGRAVADRAGAARQARLAVAHMPRAVIAEEALLADARARVAAVAALDRVRLHARRLRAQINKGVALDALEASLAGAHEAGSGLCRVGADTVLARVRVARVLFVVAVLALEAVGARARVLSNGALRAHATVLARLGGALVDVRRAVLAREARLAQAHAALAEVDAGSGARGVARRRSAQVHGLVAEVARPASLAVAREGERAVAAAGAVRATRVQLTRVDLVFAVGALVAREALALVAVDLVVARAAVHTWAVGAVVDLLLALDAEVAAVAHARGLTEPVNALGSAREAAGAVQRALVDVDVARDAAVADVAVTAEARNLVHARAVLACLSRAVVVVDLARGALEAGRADARDGRCQVDAKAAVVAQLGDVGAADRGLLRLLHRRRRVDAQIAELGRVDSHARALQHALELAGREADVHVRERRHTRRRGLGVGEDNCELHLEAVLQQAALAARQEGGSRHGQDAHRLGAVCRRLRGDVRAQRLLRGAGEGQHGAADQKHLAGADDAAVLGLD
mmetsp:Transcript_24408/g.84840  ORF Transcript_24408/g.84840 Transcript_24408/m.84840 type:complete len:725 (-) Transcript_24408:1070-3244(-)